MMKRIYVVLFSILYLCIAVISCIHAYEFFGLANSKIMAGVLSGAFEIGQAAVLFALLTSNKERSKLMPWVLMVIFTLVQIMGNIYACYKYILLNSQDLLAYFKEPIFIWTNLPDAQATVIVTYIVAAILPICGLLLTSMVTNFLGRDVDDEENRTENEQVIEQKFEEEKIIDNSVKDKVENYNSVLGEPTSSMTFNIIPREQNNNDDNKVEEPETTEDIVEDDKEPVEDIQPEEQEISGTIPQEEEINNKEELPEVKVSEKSLEDADNLMAGPIPQKLDTSYQPSRKNSGTSHFVSF